MIHLRKYANTKSILAYTIIIAIANSSVAFIKLAGIDYIKSQLAIDSANRWHRDLNLVTATRGRFRNGKLIAEIINRDKNISKVGS